MPSVLDDQVTNQGETFSIRVWCNILGLNSNTVRARINYYGWTPEQALNFEHRVHANTGNRYASGRLSPLKFPSLNRKTKND